jgi:hypothetical protein
MAETWVVFEKHRLEEFLAAIDQLPEGNDPSVEMCIYGDGEVNWQAANSEAEGKVEKYFPDGGAI